MKKKKSPRPPIAETAPPVRPLSVPNWVDGLILAIIVAFAAYLRSRFLGIPFERDEGTYAYFGQLVLDGEIPYTSFYEIKPPGLFYAYAFLIRVFGATVDGLQLGFLLVNLVSLAALYGLVRLIVGRVAAPASALAFSVLSLSPHASGFTCQAEHLVVMPALAGLCLLAAAARSDRRALMAGAAALLGSSFLIKQNGAFFVLCGALFWLAHLLRKNLSWPAILKQAMIFGIGAAAPYAIACAVLWYQGAFSDFLYWTFDYARHYTTESSFMVGRQRFLRTFRDLTQGYEALWILSAAGLLSVPPPLSAGRAPLFVWLFFICSFLTVCPGFWFYGHYYLMWIPAVSAAAGVAVESLANLLRRRLDAALSVTIAALVFAVSFGDAWIKHQRYYLNPDHTAVLRAVYGSEPFPEAKVVGDAVRKKAREGDRLAVLGSDLEIYFYTGLRSPSRHVYLTYLVDGTPRHAQFQREFIQDMETAPPRFVVLFKHPASWMVYPTADKTILSWINPFVNQHYTLTGAVDMIAPDRTNYVWGVEAAGYKPIGNYRIYLFERREMN